MPKKVFEKFTSGRNEYSFVANDEYNGHTYHKFQKKNVDNHGNVKWQTLTVKPEDTKDFCEWLDYILLDFKGGTGEDVPF